VRIIDDAPCRNGNHRIVVEIKPGERAVVGLDGENVTLHTLAATYVPTGQATYDRATNYRLPEDTRLFRLVAVSPEPPKEPLEPRRHADDCPSTTTRQHQHCTCHLSGVSPEPEGA